MATTSSTSSARHRGGDRASTQVNIANSEGANDVLQRNGRRRRRTSDHPALRCHQATEDGGAGDDTLFGSQGVDTFLGGDGNEFTFGDNGNDVASWASATTTSSSGLQATTPSRVRTAPTRCLFFGANIAENFDIAPNGGTYLFSATLLP